MHDHSPKTGDLEVGKRIASRRTELNMSRNDLARDTNLSYSYIAQIETGYRLPSIKQQWVIAKALGTSLDDLFGTEEPPPVPDRLMASPPPRTARVSIDGAIEHAAQEIEALPASRRLEALTELQRRIIHGLANEKPSGEWR